MVSQGDISKRDVVRQRVYGSCSPRPVGGVCSKQYKCWHWNNNWYNGRTGNQNINSMKELGKSNPKELSIEATAYSQSISIETIGAIINRQTYDATSNTYEPDFSQRPCQLFPKCFLIDPKLLILHL